MTFKNRGYGGARVRRSCAPTQSNPTPVRARRGSGSPHPTSKGTGSRPERRCARAAPRGSCRSAGGCRSHSTPPDSLCRRARWGMRLSRGLGQAPSRGAGAAAVRRRATRPTPKTDGPIAEATCVGDGGGAMGLRFRFVVDIRARPGETGPRRRRLAEARGEGIAFADRSRRRTRAKPGREPCPQRRGATR